MSEEALRRGQQLQAFYGQFLMPLLSGRALCTTAPLSMTDLNQAREADYAQSEHALEIADVLAHHASDFSIAPRRVEGESLAFAFVLHNLLLGSDNKFCSKLNMTRRQRFIDQTTQLAEITQALHSRSDVLVRDALLAQMQKVHRKDTTYSFWLGSRQFDGRAVPSHLFQLSALRRVKTREEHTPLAHFLTTISSDSLGIQIGQLWTSLQAHSPLTLLFDPNLKASSVNDNLLRVIADPALRTGLIKRAMRTTQLARTHAIGTVLEAVALAPEKLTAQSAAVSLLLETQISQAITGKYKVETTDSYWMQTGYALLDAYLQAGYGTRAQGFSEHDTVLMQAYAYDWKKVLSQEAVERARKLIEATAKTSEPLFSTLDATA